MTGKTRNWEMSRDNLKYHLCPSVKRGVRKARPGKRSVGGGGTEVSCALALSGGGVRCLVPQQPHPLS